MSRINGSMPVSHAQPAATPVQNQTANSSGAASNQSVGNSHRADLETKTRGDYVWFDVDRDNGRERRGGRVLKDNGRQIEVLDEERKEVHVVDRYSGMSCGFRDATEEELQAVVMLQQMQQQLVDDRQQAMQDNRKRDLIQKQQDKKYTKKSDLNEADERAKLVNASHDETRIDDRNLDSLRFQNSNSEVLHDSLSTAEIILAKSHR